MGTNNPSEDQIERVQSQIIAIAQSITGEADMLEANSYFDECGFDSEARALALAAKLKTFCKNADDLDPNIEDQPQPRRMARYLLENVEYEILDAPLSTELLSSKPVVSSKGSGAGGESIAGLPRNAVLAIAALLVLLFFVALYFALATPTVDPGAVPHHHGGRGGDLGGGRGGRPKCRLAGAALAGGESGGARARGRRAQRRARLCLRRTASGARARPRRPCTGRE